MIMSAWGFNLNRKWTYENCCYFSELIYPFGFCKDCWIKAGKPIAMDGSTGGKVNIYE